MWCWGENVDGQFGLGDMNNRHTPTHVGADTDWAEISAGRSHTSAIRTDQTLWSWGKNKANQLGLGHYHKEFLVPHRSNHEVWIGSAATLEEAQEPC